MFDGVAHTLVQRSVSGREDARMPSAIVVHDVGRAVLGVSSKVLHGGKICQLELATLTDEHVCWWLWGGE